MHQLVVGGGGPGGDARRVRGHRLLQPVGAVRAQPHGRRAVHARQRPEQGAALAAAGALRDREERRVLVAGHGVCTGWSTYVCREDGSYLAMDGI